LESYSERKKKSIFKSKKR